MRESKFRAWNKDWDGMVYSHLETLFGKREFYPFGFDVGFSHYPTDGWRLMQYTGLKDKNGQEIYEGDIVLISDTYTAFVEYSEERAAFAFTCKNRPMCADFLEVYYEVIGNIHDNPELLKEGNHA